MRKKGKYLDRCMEKEKKPEVKWKGKKRTYFDSYM